MASQRYGDGFMFMCEYARSGRAKCKACRNDIAKNHLKIGTRGIAYDHWDDSLWFHYRCFWTKCFYRKNVIKLNPNDPDIVGYSELKEKDKERVRKSVAKLQEHSKAKEEVTGQPETEASSSRSGPKLITYDWRKHESKQVDATTTKGENTEKLQYKVGTTICIDVNKGEDGDLKIGFTHASDIGKEQEEAPREDNPFYLSKQQWEKLVSGETTDSIKKAIMQTETASIDDESEKGPKRKKMKPELQEGDENSNVVDLLPNKLKVKVTLKILDDVKRVFVTMEKQHEEDDGGFENFQMTKQEWENVETKICDIDKGLEEWFKDKD